MDRARSPYFSSLYLRLDGMESRQVCQTDFVKKCELETVTDCMPVTELRCQVGPAVREGIECW